MTEAAVGDHDCEGKKTLFDFPALSVSDDTGSQNRSQLDHWLSIVQTSTTSGKCLQTKHMFFKTFNVSERGNSVLLLDYLFSTLTSRLECIVCSGDVATT